MNTRTEGILRRPFGRLLIFVVTGAVFKTMAALLLMTAVGMAQNQMTVTATKIAYVSGKLLANGEACLQPVDNWGAPISFRMADGGQGMHAADCVPVRSGSFSISVPNVALTNRTNVCLKLTVRDPNNNEVLLGKGYECLQPQPSAYWCSGSACNLDNYIPTGDANTQVIAGPAGPSGGSPAGSSGDVQTNNGAGGLAALPQNTWVKTTGNETVAGVKTFTSSPVVPTPVGANDAANKSYVDAHAGGGGGAWGTITGTMSSQSDLQSALNGKAASNASATINGTTCYLGGSCTISGGGGAWGSITGTLSSQSDLNTALNAKQAKITANNVVFCNASGTCASATAAEIVALFGGGSCSGYLKSDGTCDAGGGGGSGTVNSGSSYKLPAYGSGAGAAVSPSNLSTDSTGDHLTVPGSGSFAQVSTSYSANVKSLAYGATGNGSTDDSAAIQAATNAVISSGGGTIFFPPGTYYVNTLQTSPFDGIVNVSANHLHYVCAPGAVINVGNVLTNNGTATTMFHLGYPATNVNQASGYAAGTIASVGASSITTTTHSDAGNFAQGDIIYLKGATGADGQPFGEFDYVESANASTGVITLTRPLNLPYPTTLLAVKATSLVYTDNSIEGCEVHSPGRLRLYWPSDRHQDQGQQALRHRWGDTGGIHQLLPATN